MSIAARGGAATRVGRERRARGMNRTWNWVALVALAFAAVARAETTLVERAVADDVGASVRARAGRRALGAKPAVQAPEPPPPPATKKERLRAQFELAREDAERAPCAPSKVQGGREAKCDHVRSTDACDGRLKAYLEYSYCDDEAFGMQNMVTPVIGLTLIAVASTYALAVAAGTFFVPALEYTATLMKISPEAAGVTLLALGNGAPDLYAQVSELSEGVLPDLNVVIGSTLGSGFFIATVVLGVVIRASPNAVVINKDALGASMGLFAVANIALLLAMCFGTFKMWYTMTFFVSYATYFCFIAFRDTSIHDAQGDRPSLEEGKGEKRLEPLFDLASQKGGPDDIKGSVRPMKTTAKDGDGIVASATADMNVYEKKLALITVPVRVAMAFTMPVVRAGDMDKFYAVTLGFIGPFFFLCAPGNEFMSVIGSDEATTMLYNIAVAGACSFGVAAVVSTKYKATPLPASTEFASMFAFVQSICWMHLMSNELVMSLGALAKIFGIDEEVFGVSFVAWGDGIGDLVACHAVAKAGQVTMAVVACFAGPVFNLLIGLASSIAFLTTILGDLPFNVKQGEIVLAVGCLFSVMFTISQLRHRSPREFEIPRSFANAAFATYGAFLLIYLLCEARLLFVSKLAS